MVFKPINRYFKVIANTLYISSWKSKGLSAKSIKPPAVSDNSLIPLIDCLGNKRKLKFSGSCLKQPKLQYAHWTVVNIYIVYELGDSGSSDNNPTLKNCLFDGVNLTKNSDVENYGYFGYGTGFDLRNPPLGSRSLIFLSSGFRQNVLIFGADMSSSTHISNKKKEQKDQHKG